ncbi:Serine/threonine-protein kinase Nek4 [Tetrabaena socialis]|uniref:non-specific serine/threonine protein kinase n=1 Tax=Tetrabaena socialis TaxID=47790 RepID=A0A2J8A5G1_9CHLO|nr:Serine/threonine-protein kinase Nek4 [Tetrabaena socialis]|eukprot:PNH07758.1 Serine/threonine-protein kinase Nek4 [Tetrabaena socialis]
MWQEGSPGFSQLSSAAAPGTQREPLERSAAKMEAYHSEELIGKGTYGKVFKIYEEQPYSFKSDVWALGCVMYEMMTGRAAFAADNLSRVVLRVIRGQYDPLPDAYSSALRTVVTSMLCKEVAARPDANVLLTVPAVVPHVQSYLESLTAESPAGWATWRMKLPLAAMVQMSEALEAAGVAQSGRRSRPGTGPSSGRTSYSGMGQLAEEREPSTHRQCISLSYSSMLATPPPALGMHTSVSSSPRASSHQQRVSSPSDCPQMSLSFSSCKGG